MILEDITIFITLGALAIGYVIQETTTILRLRAKIIAWEQRLFEAALIGGIMLFLSRAMIIYFFSMAGDTEFYVFSYQTLKSIMPFSFSGTVVVALLISQLFSRLINWFMPFQKANFCISRRYGDLKTKLLLKAALEQKVVLVCLNSQSIYIGLINSVPLFGNSEQYFKMFILLQGISKIGGADIVIERDYSQFFLDTGTAVKDDNLRESLVIVLPLADVSYVRFFSSRLYSKEFQSDENKS